MNAIRLIHKKMPLSDMILANVDLLSVLKRFDIVLGIGDKTIADICAERNINLDFFLAIVNIFHNKEYFPTEKLQSFSIGTIVHFLKKSHYYYNQEIIPAIEVLIHQLYWKGSDHERNLQILQKFFNEYRKEVKTHTDHEEETVYPYMVYVEETCMKKDYIEECYQKIKQYSITNYAEEHNNIDEKLTDLKNIIIKYLPPSNNQDIAFRILQKLFKLENDLKHHADIEEKILVPKILEMEKKLEQMYLGIKKS